MVISCVFQACQKGPKISFIQETIQTQPLPNRPLERSTYKHYLAHQIVENSTKMQAMKMGEDIANDRFCYCINNSLNGIPTDLENRDFMMTKLYDICKEQGEKEISELINAQVTPQFKKLIREAYDEVASDCDIDFKKERYSGE